SPDLWSRNFDGDGGRFAAADAQGGDTAAAAPGAQRVYERDDDSRTGRADRVAQRTRAAVDVHFRVLEAEILHRGHGHAGDRLVDLVQVDVARAPPGALEKRPEGADRGGGEPRRLLRRARLPDDACEHRQAAAPRLALAHEDGRGGAVGDRRRAGRGDRAALPGRRPEARGPADVLAKRPPAAGGPA